jgi:hypothetical protein
VRGNHLFVSSFVASIVLVLALLRAAAAQSPVPSGYLGSRAVDGAVRYATLRAVTPR